MARSGPDAGAGIGAGAGERALGWLVSIRAAHVGFLDLRIGLFIAVWARAGSSIPPSIAH